MLMASKISTSFPQIQQNSCFFSSQKPLNLNFNVCYVNFSSRKTPNFAAAKCCLNLPLELQSSVGKSLNTVIQNKPRSFYDAVSVELNRISEDRDAAFARYIFSLGSSEVTLHRSIAKLKEAESQLAVEDILYSIILYKFSEIRVPLVPRLSKCLYNGRLEILPSKDGELESIHSYEVLEMVKEHIGAVLGWKVGSSVSVNWSTTNVWRHHLSQVYAASILYGYFLKSASIRLRLEHNLRPTYQNIPFGRWTPLPGRKSCGSENVVFGDMVTPRLATLSQVTTEIKEATSLKCYVTGFDMLTLKECAKPKSEEVVDLINKHCLALFGNDKDVQSNDIIITSLSSLKRLVLEAVAFGCFLWDAEECVDSKYKLKVR